MRHGAGERALVDSKSKYEDLSEPSAESYKTLLLSTFMIEYANSLRSLAIWLLCHGKAEVTSEQGAVGHVH